MMRTNILIGVGEMGGVFARGMLRAGLPVYPVTRNTQIKELANEIDPAMVVVAVTENTLDSVIEDMPEAWKSKLVLLQNELLPNDWKKHNLPTEPTVISVWFEKKPGFDPKVIIPSPIHGPLAGNIALSLGTLNISSNIIKTDDDMLIELVKKNLYILTTNIAGIITGGTVGDLWENHRELANEVATEVLFIQSYLTGKTFNHQDLISDMVNTFNCDPQHKCMGRSAPQRLERAIDIAHKGKLKTPKLHEIQASMK